MTTTARVLLALSAEELELVRGLVADELGHPMFDTLYEKIINAAPIAAPEACLEPITPAARAAVERLLDPPVESTDVRFLLDGLGVASIGDLAHLVTMARKAGDAFEVVCSCPDPCPAHARPESIE